MVVVLLSLAGCVSTQPAALTQASAAERGIDDLVFALGDIIEAAIPIEGDLMLHGTVFLPDVPPGTKVPVVMDMGPYYGSLGGETSDYNTEHPPNRLYEHLLRRGYAIALVSVRGTGLSEGCFMVGGPQERADVAAAVEWLAAQEWSTGSVAMTGVSYDGTTPWEGLVSGAAPSLKAIVPVEAISDFYRYSFFEGVPIGGGAAFNTYYLAEVDMGYTSAAHVIPWVPTLASNVCPEQVEVYTTPYETYRDGVHGAYWDERDMSAMLNGSTAAVFAVHGFKDFNVKMDQVQTLWDLLPGPRRMLLGQWEHNIPWSNSYDPKLNFTEYNVTIDQFLDAYVKGDEAALAAERAAPPVLVQDSANVTWGLTRWPPVESLPTAYGLGADGKMATGEAAEGSARITASPAEQLFPRAGRSGVGPLRLQALDFETAPMDADAHFFGNPYITVQVQVDQPRGSLEARLYEVTASDEWILVSEGWQNLATRTSRDQAESVPTGTPMDVRILMQGMAQVVEKGNRLVLTFSADNSATLTPHVQVTTFTFTLGGPKGAALWLPVFSAAPES